MPDVTHLLLTRNLLDPRSVIETSGMLGIFVMLFAETGLLIGVLLPGDSVLFTAGLLTSNSSVVNLPLPWVLASSVGGRSWPPTPAFCLGNVPNVDRYLHDGDHRHRGRIDDSDRLRVRSGSARLIQTDSPPLWRGVPGRSTSACVASSGTARVRPRRHKCRGH